MGLNILITILLMTSLAVAQDAGNWSEGALIPPTGRENPFNLSPQDLEKSKTQGQIHAQIYPVTVTGILPPIKPIQRLIGDQTGNVFREFFQKLFQKISGYRNLDDMMVWLGLHPYPKDSDVGVYQLARPEGLRPGTRVGYGEISRNGAVGFTLSCATCHSANLFGKTVLGMTNRFPRANDFFIKAQKVSPFLMGSFFRFYAGASRQEVQLIEEIKTNIHRVGLKSPLALGLDTSLAQVSLSLNKRQADAWATPNSYLEYTPASDWLDKHPADSKPAVWWNVKYKNRWLSDGSVVSGQPIFTNLLWNEIGRGTDLHELEKWIESHPQVIQDLTNAVFNSQPPRMTDFFPESHFDMMSVRRGEKIFEENCSHCHGQYLKNWSLPESATMSISDQLKTYQVIYHRQTPVHNVGTDSNRALGMRSLEKLNRLEISQRHGIVIKAQNGYVPPPLVGIWARWPYLHNNSIPNLCQLLTPSKQRVSSYWSGEAQDPKSDFDKDCNGYPLAEKTPAAWKTKDHFFNTQREGLSNFGHDDGIFILNGVEILSSEDKKDLIQFLQTL